jgi:hypothetical protein
MSQAKAKQLIDKYRPAGILDGTAPPDILQLFVGEITADPELLDLFNAASQGTADINDAITRLDGMTNATSADLEPLEPGSKLDGAADADLGTTGPLPVASEDVVTSQTQLPLDRDTAAPELGGAQGIKDSSGNRPGTNDDLANAEARNSSGQASDGGVQAERSPELQDLMNALSEEQKAAFMKQNNMQPLGGLNDPPPAEPGMMSKAYGAVSPYIGPSLKVGAGLGGLAFGGSMVNSMVNPDTTGGLEPRYEGDAASRYSEPAMQQEGGLADPYQTQGSGLPKLRAFLGGNDLPEGFEMMPNRQARPEQQQPMDLSGPLKQQILDTRTL